jgi:iron complex transport system substrate-binding protein
MKSALRSVAAALTALTLAACSSASGGSAGGGGPTGESGGASETRTITDAEGTAVSVPTLPRRIVALSEPTLDALVALHITPVGATAGRGQSSVPDYLADELKDVPILGSIAQPNYEAIAAAKPDLILVDGTSINNNATAIKTLRAIAPTVVTGYAGGEWRANFTIVADAVDQAAAGKQVIADYDAHVAAVKAKLGAYRGKTFSIVRWQGGAPSLILKELLAGQALADLDLKRPANQDRKGPGHSEPVSLENLGQIDANYIFFGTLGGSSVSNPDAGGAADTAAAEKALAQAMKVPGFGQLEAVRQGHAIPVDGAVWTSTGGPVLMQDIVSDVERALTGKAQS